MKKLTVEQFNQAKEFIFKNGRSLDQQLFKFHFAKGDSQSVINELTKYQNADGGFGHALEPDLRTKHSSAVASSIALHILNTMDVDSDHPMLKKTIAYYLETLDKNKWIWAIAPTNRKDAPHAPWWSADDIVAEFRGCIANPTADIIAGLLKHKELISKNILESLLNRVVTYIKEIKEKSLDFEMHDLICYLSLANSKYIEQTTKDQITPFLIEKSKSIVETNRDKWQEYCARPLWLCTDTNSILYPHLKEIVEVNLDYEIETMNADGSWSPFWSWFGNFENTWPIAKQEWSSHLTLNNLLKFKSFNRLELR